MPYIPVKSGALSVAQKAGLIQRLTQTASEVMHVPPEFFTITIKELPDQNFGIGGRAIDKVKAEYIQKHQTI